MLDGFPEVKTKVATKFVSFDFEDADLYKIRTQIRVIQENINIQSVEQHLEEIKELRLVKKVFENNLRHFETNSSYQRPPSRKKTYRSLLETKLSVKEDRIRYLTKQAQVDATCPGLAEQDVQAIIDYLIPRSAEDRIPVIYLIDSILKNVRNHYLELFLPHVEGIMVKTFKHGKPSTRQRVMKVLAEWKKQHFFPPSLFAKIDRELQRFGRPNPSPSNPINVIEMVKKMELQIQQGSRYDLLPLLNRIKEKIRRNLDITTDFIIFANILSKPPNFVNIVPEFTPGSRPSRPHQHPPRMGKRPLEYSNHSVRNVKPKLERKKPPKIEPETVWTHPNGAVTFFACMEQDELHKEHKRSFKLLYHERLERCYICGLRVKRDNMAAHHDAHLKENEEKKIRLKQARMRVWYLPYDDWLRDATVSNRAVNLFFPDKNTKQKQKKEPKKVPANDECTSCFICGESFKKVFDQKEDDWVYVGAVYEDGRVSRKSRESKRIVHERCYEDTSNKSSSKPTGIKRLII